MRFNKSIITRLSLSSYLCVMGLSAAEPLPSTKTECPTHKISSINQQWLNEFGRAEINLGKTNTDPLHGDVTLLLPLAQDQRQLLFTQGNWQRTQGGTTLNIGVGQRWFNKNAAYWGYNLFYDYQLQGQHKRLGLGLEQRLSSLSWALNSYLPLSAKQLVDNRANTVRPAQGVDMRLQYQPLQQPHWRFNLMAERYFGHTLSENNKTLCHNRSAVTAGVDYTPWPLITAGYSCQLGSVGQRAHQLGLRLTYRLGMPLAQQLDPQQVAAAHSLVGHRLALVQRNHHIVLQQKPNDEIQLELPQELRGNPGAQHTISLNLKTSRPRDEWALEWRGDLVNHAVSPQVNAGKDQAILILPQRSGIYTLQLVARNVRGVISYSNQMRVIVEERARVKPAISGKSHVSKRQANFHPEGHKIPILPTEMKEGGSAPILGKFEKTTHLDPEERQDSDSEPDYTTSEEFEETNSSEPRESWDSDSEPDSTTHSRSTSTASEATSPNRPDAGVHYLTEFKEPENIEEACRLLGVDPFDTLKNIRKARNDLARTFHKDKSIQRGDGPATQKLNEEKMKTVTAAYEMIEAHKSPEDPLA